MMRPLWANPYDGFDESLLPWEALQGADVEPTPELAPISSQPRGMVTPEAVPDPGQRLHELNWWQQGLADWGDQLAELEAPPGMRPSFGNEFLLGLARGFGGSLRRQGDARAELQRKLDAQAAKRNERNLSLADEQRAATRQAAQKLAEWRRTSHLVTEEEGQRYGLKVGSRITPQEFVAAQRAAEDPVVMVTPEQARRLGDSSLAGQRVAFSRLQSALTASRNADKRGSGGGGSNDKADKKRRDSIERVYADKLKVVDEEIKGVRDQILKGSRLSREQLALYGPNASPHSVLVKLLADRNRIVVERENAYGDVKLEPPPVEIDAAGTDAYIELALAQGVAAADVEGNRETLAASGIDVDRVLKTLRNPRPAPKQAPTKRSPLRVTSPNRAGSLY